MVGRPVIRALVATLALAVGAAARAQEGAPPPPTRVAAVELALPAPDEHAAELVGISPGERLSTRALRQAVQRLHQTGRYRTIRIRAAQAQPPPGESGEWVRLVVEATPVRRISRVTIRGGGAGGLDEAAVRDLARLAVGEAFEEQDVAAAEARVRDGLARRGYREARATLTAKGDVSVAVEVSIEAGPVTQVHAVALAGDPGLPSGVLARLATRPGAPLDEDLLAEDTRRLRVALHLAGWRRASVGKAQVTVQGGQAEVAFPISAGPRVAVLFRGNAALPAALLERELALDPEQPLDPSALETGTEKLLTAYRVRGYAAAKVEVVEELRGARLAVVFRIEEGVRYRVQAIRFPGVSARSERALRDQLVAYLREEDPPQRSPEADATRSLAVSIPGAPARPVPPVPLPGGEYLDGAAWDRAAQQLVDDYRADGYLEAVYLGSAVTLDARLRTAQVTLRLREGPRTLVERLEFVGNEAFASDELARLVPLKPGDPLAYPKVEEARAALLRRYASTGHAWARVEANEVMDRGRHTGTLRFDIREGPQARIARVLIGGNRRTKPEVVREALALTEGAVWDPEAAARSEAALLSLGVFRSVNLHLHEPDAPMADKDLVVEVSERPYATLTQGTGFSIANGPRAVVEYVRPNLGGHAVELSLRGKLNYPIDVLDNRPDLAAKPPRERIEGRADVGLRTSRSSLLPVPSGAHADVIGEVLHRRAYNLARASAVAGLDAGLTSRLVASIQGELEVDNIDRTGASGPLTQADVERLRFSEGITTLTAIRPSLTLDYRDNPAHPRRGWYATGYGEYERSLGSDGQGALFGLLPASDIHSNLIKAAATLSGYLPLGQASTFALSARGGRVWPLDSDSQTIVPRRFFLGGATSMRGFAEEQMIQEDVRPILAREAALCATSPTGVGCTDRGREIAQGKTAVSEGGEAFLLAKAELRLSLTPSFEAGLFMDLGNLWLDPANLGVGRLRANAGFGLRFVTPVGPAALDVGFNLSPDQRINEATWAPHFTIGLF